MEVDPSLVEVRRGVEGDAALGDRTVEVLDRAEVLVGERLVEHRPEALGRLELGAVGRQVDEPDPLGDGQPGLRVPAGVVEDEDDDPVATGPGLAGEEGEERLEERLRHAPQTRSSRPPRPPRDPSPAARSPGRAGPSGRPPRRGTAPPAPPRSSVPPLPPLIRLPQAKAPVYRLRHPPGTITEHISRKPYHMDS